MSTGGDTMLTGGQKKLDKTLTKEFRKAMQQVFYSDSDTDNANAQSRIAIGFNVSNGTDNSVKIGSGGNFISNTYNPPQILFQTH